MRSLRSGSTLRTPRRSSSSTRKDLAEAAYAGAYVRPRVLLELGAKSDHDPQVPGTVRPYAAEAFAVQFASPTVEIPTLGAERTFWEKAILLHERAMRPKATQADRFSRHYHDVVVLARSSAGQACRRSDRGC